MTSEVALMNKAAVALGADSAATVTYWNPTKRQSEQRYFKRVNKIFNVVAVKPVGLMTYAAGSLQGLPWEVLVKAYRDARTGFSRDQLPSYATDFFDYLAANRDIFPQESQHQELLAKVSDSVAALTYDLLWDDTYSNAQDAQTKRAAADVMIGNAEANITGHAYINDTAREIHDEIRADSVSIRDHILQSPEGQHFVTELEAGRVDRLIELGITRLFKEGTPLEYTGIVVAGYGERQYMPQLEQFIVFGLFNNRLLYTRLDSGCRQITFKNTSDIVPIAQADMIHTFSLGAGVSTLNEISNSAGLAIDEFSAALVTAGHLQSNVDVTALKATATQAFYDRVRSYIWNVHSGPLRQVIGMLSPEELAELAETLVSAESLKERVTRPTESVSGPVDVAVISKSDGFIWIKRKHYFDPKLNLRFVAKKQQEVT